MDGEHGEDRGRLVQEGHEERLGRESPESVHGRGKSKFSHMSRMHRAGLTIPHLMI